MMPWWMIGIGPKQLGDDNTQVNYVTYRGITWQQALMLVSLLFLARVGVRFIAFSSSCFSAKVA